MKFIDDIRRERLGALAKSLGGVTSLARALERSDAQVSQWIRGAAHSTTGRKRGMKSETARWIEATTGMPEGWLDSDPTASEAQHAAEPAAEYLVPPRHSRALVQTICNLAEQINDDGLRELSGFARCLTGTHPLKKPAPAKPKKAA